MPGSESDVQALKKLPMTVAPESKIYGDSAYTDYTIEDDIRQVDLIELIDPFNSSALLMIAHSYELNGQIEKARVTINHAMKQIQIMLTLILPKD